MIGGCRSPDLGARIGRRLAEIDLTGEYRDAEGGSVAVFQRTASFATTCLRCGGAIRPGDRILWSSADERAKHQVCPKPEPEVSTGNRGGAPTRT
jgi:hypothetical protein